MRGIVAIAACVTSLASHAFAQTTAFTLAGGVALPSGGAQGVGSDFKTSYGYGFIVGAGVARNLSPALALGIALDYARFGIDEAGYLDGGTGSVSGGEQSILTLGLELRYTIAGGTAPAAPYVIAGVSAMKLADVSIATTSPNAFEETKLSRDGLAQDVGLNLGAGIAFGPGRRFFVEARAVLGLYDQASYIPVRAGVSFAR